MSYTYTHPAIQEPKVQSYFAIPGMVREKVNDYTLNDIVNTVAAAFEVEAGLVFGKCKHHREKWARWCAWRIMYSRGFSKADCGRLLGGHDHTTVINAFRKLDDDIEKVPLVANAWEKVKHLMGHNTYTRKNGLTVGQI